MNQATATLLLIMTGFIFGTVLSGFALTQGKLTAIEIKLDAIQREVKK